MRSAPLAAFALLIAACGQDPAGTDGSAESNQIERLSTLQEEEVDLVASVRLQPLSDEDLAGEGLVGTGCAFSSGGQRLLVAVGSDALARLEGELRHFVQSAPIGESGGFFEDRQLSISVGRSEAEEGMAGAAGGWPARATVTNRRTEQQREIRGEWRCGA
jgi:hypothetical protein